MAHAVGQSATLDQFFTKPEIAEQCWRTLSDILGRVEMAGPGDFFFVEPSAGAGDFFDVLPPGRRVGIDIEPRREEFIRHDFLQWTPDHLDVDTPRAGIAVIGNPPFGKRGKMAVAFFQHASLIADTIGFIVPVIFRKHFIHKQLPLDFRWVHSIPLPRDAFWTDARPSYNVNTEFQIWTRLAVDLTDQRLHKPPPIRHRDFKLYQYNNTPDALKVFGYDFDFAVPCQGWQDYSRRERSAEGCEPHKQWMLIKAHTFAALRRLYARIDYEALALAHTTSVPGFRKGDLVKEYTQRYG